MAVAGSPLHRNSRNWERTQFCDDGSKKRKEAHHATSANTLYVIVCLHFAVFQRSSQPPRRRKDQSADFFVSFLYIKGLTIMGRIVIWLLANALLNHKSMKRFQTIAAYLVALALTGAFTVRSDQPGRIRGRATVRTVMGNATYNVNGTTLPLKPNMELDAGASITTGPDSVVYLNVNGLSSSVRIQADTTMAIPVMERIGSAREGDTETTLDLKTGSILGQVKKVSGNSTYEIKTPHGVAGIRGTDFEVTAQPLPDGKFLVTFTSVQGIVIVSAIVAGEIQTRTLKTGDSWTPGEGEPHPAPQNLIDQYLSLIDEMNGIFQNPPTGPGPLPIVPVFPTGSPPGQTNTSSTVPSGGGGGE
jgi:hypothetical protein